MAINNKSLIFIFILIVISTVASATSIILQPGINDVAIKVNNELNTNLATIKVIIDEAKLPKGINISCNSNSIDVAAKNKSQQGLLLHIKVSEDVQEGNYEIPFTLKDNVNRSWNYSIRAELKIIKPENYELLQNYPNLFNAVTRIKYALKEKQRAQLVIFNVLGERIRTLLNENQTAGNYNITWDGKDEDGNIVPNGIYFYKIKAGSFVSMKKMTLLK